MTLPFPVVAVGASAGGLEAFSGLLRKIPADTPIALLLVQHLAPQHESLLPELLQQSTSLRVVQAQDRVAIQSGYVYVIPPDASMTVTDGHLALAPRATTPRMDLPIDRLFRSVAETYRDKAIGVVLSGGASDGAAGVREIKEAGGITIAQDPDEAGLDSMPRAAIATGAVDVVLTIAGIAEELVRLATHPFLRAPGGRLEELGESEHLRRLFALLRRSSGVDFSLYKSPTLMRRIQRRMVLHRLATVEAYLDFLRDNAGELEALYEDVLIHVTSFFREPESFEALKERVFPSLAQGHSPESPIRLWVPGCSSGEEVYSLAIALHEFLGEQAEYVPVQIFGTDVSQKMIDRARAGLYPLGVASDVGPERLRRFFVKVDGAYRISKSIRERCVFARQDIARDPPFSKLHLIVCRNLLIYLGQPLQRKVIEVFHYALRSTGFLVLGRSETTGPHADLFSLADKRFKIYRKKPGSVVTDLDFAAPAAIDPVILPARAPRPTAIPARSPEGDLQGEANRLILDRYGPPGVIVDGSLRIVKTRGRTSPFLELPPGEASLELLKMARQGLLFGLRNALTESRSRNAPVRKESLRLTTEGAARLIDIDVTPMGPAHNRHFLVLFEESGAASRATSKKPGARGKKAETRVRGNPVVKHLEEELEASRQYLQSIIRDLEGANEELQSANEEILSSNEELQSTNEELDTAKEELQSTNEELSTLNEELHGRNEELSRSNSDLVNLLASVHIPIVIVTGELKIRRFTPAAEKLLNLIPADIGRPIGHIKPNIQCPDLEVLIGEVIESISIREREVSDVDGYQYLLRIRPYKNVENRIDGAVLTLFDVSTARLQEEDIKRARTITAALLEVVDNPILLLGPDRTVRQVSKAFLDTFKVPASEVVGHALFEVAQGRWNLPALRQALGQVQSEQHNIEGLHLGQTFPNLGRRDLVVDVLAVPSGGRDHAAAVLVVRSLTPASE